MYKTIIAQSVYDKIIAAERGKPASQQSYLYKLLKQQPMHLLSADENENIKLHPEEVLSNPSSAYILDITPTEAMGIQSHYGVICIPGDNVDISPLIDVADYFNPSTEKKKFNGWDKVLDSVETLPSNALVIKDRYLFSKRNKQYGDGLANLRLILNELLPKKFEGGEYHITVVFDVEEKHYTYTYDEIATKINNIVHQLRIGYKFMVEVFGIKESCTLYNDTHDRQILSNYYFIEASHQLAAFTPEDLGTVNQSITPWALFTHSSLDGNSSAPLEQIEQTIHDFHDFYASLSNKAEHNTYLYALNGKRMERCTGVRNRLLK